MVKGVDEWEGRGTVQSSTVIERRRDVNRGLVDIWDAEVDFSHVAQSSGILDPNIQ
jgi:hypothetical protein